MILFKRRVEMSSTALYKSRKVLEQRNVKRELNQGSSSEGTLIESASKKAGRQRLTSNTRKAFSRSHAPEVLVYL